MSTSDVMMLLSGGLQGAGSAIGGSAGTEVKPFDRIPVGDTLRSPQDLLGIGLTAVARQGQSLAERAEEDITLPSALAGTPEGFPGFAVSGFGTIPGPTGRDPAHADPSLLVSKGTLLKDPFQSIGDYYPTSDTQGSRGLTDSTSDTRGLTGQDSTYSDPSFQASEGGALSARVQQILGGGRGPSRSLFSQQDSDQGLAAIDLLRTARSG